MGNGVSRDRRRRERRGCCCPPAAPEVMKLVILSASQETGLLFLNISRR